MINMADVAAHIRAMAVLASEAGEVVAVVASVAHTPSTSVLPVPTEILPLTIGSNLEQCVSKFCNCVKAAVVAVDGAIVVTMTIPPLERPAKLLQQRLTI